MTFVSLAYVAFLPLVLLAFGRASAAARPWILLGASVTFGAWLGAPTVVIGVGGVVIVTYLSGLRVRTSSAAFWGGVAANIGVLAGARALSGSLDVSSGASPWIVTVGLSYVVLQAISYLVDVYIGTEKPEPRLHRLALSLTFFPKFIQGPIERSGPLLAQFDGLRPVDAANLRAGAIRFASGLFKKVVVADRLAGYVDHVYDNVQGHSGIVLVLATYLYGLQLYFDFAGYTDMALGSAHAMGIRLTENFDHPYRAASVADFWRRWHISLSRWLLEYVFKPLQMSLRRWKLGTAAAILVTFVVSGAWHGTTWNFLAWGLLHGAYLAIEILLQPLRKKVHIALRLRGTRALAAWNVFLTFQLVSFAWIPFRSRNISDALYVAAHVGVGRRGLAAFLLSQGQREALITALLLLGLGAAALIRHAATTSPRITRLTAVMGGSPELRWVQYYALVVTILVLGRFTTQSFIYANF